MRALLLQNEGNTEGAWFRKPAANPRAYPPAEIHLLEVLYHAVEGQDGSSTSLQAEPIPKSAPGPPNYATQEWNHWQVIRTPQKTKLLQTLERPASEKGPAPQFFCSPGAGSWWAHRLSIREQWKHAQEDTGCLVRRRRRQWAHILTETEWWKGQSLSKLKTPVQMFPSVEGLSQVELSSKSARKDFSLPVGEVGLLAMAGGV